MTFACGSNAGGFMLAAVYQGPGDQPPNLLGLGAAHDRFAFTFAREAFTSEASCPPPDIYLVISLLTPDQKNVVAVHRHDVSGRELMDKARLKVVLPLRKSDRLVAIPGLDRFPGVAQTRRRLRLDAELIAWCVPIAEAILTLFTGWTDVAKDIRFEVVDDFVATTRRRVENLVGRADFTAHEAYLIESAGARLRAYGMFDPTQNTVFLNRRELEQQSVSFLESTLGHELVHVAQWKNHPDLAATWRKESVDLWTRHLAGTTTTKENNESLFALMANIEGYADYIERYFLVHAFTSSLTLVSETVPLPELPSPPPRPHTELDVIEEPDAPPSLRTVVITQKSAQYEAGSAAYLARPKPAGKAAPFDPLLRPEPVLPDELLKPVIEKALEGDVQSQLLLGDLYRRGGMIGVVVDRIKAQRWYRLAAAAGSPVAAERIREMSP